MYTRLFGGTKVTQSDVLNVRAHPQATIVADLASADHLPANTFDCIIATQTLQYIDDVRAAIRTLFRSVKPGGVVLATLPGISHTNDVGWQSPWCWNFTPLSAQRLFEEAFLPGDVQVQTRGNVLAAISFLHGLAAEELKQEELDYFEPGFAVNIAVRADKSGIRGGRSRR